MTSLGGIQAEVQQKVLNESKVLGGVKSVLKGRIMLLGKETIVPVGYMTHFHLWRRNLESEGSRKVSFECLR